MNGVFEKRGTWWIRYRRDGKIRREPVTWEKIRRAEITVDPATEAEQPGKILAGKLYSHYITQRNRGERSAATSTGRKVFFRELIDLGVTRATERNAGWKIDLLRLEKLRAQFGNERVERLTPQMFEYWFATQRWAPSTFNRYKDAVRICFKRGVANNLIPESLVPRIEHRRVGNNARVRYLNQFQPLPTNDPDLQFSTTEETRLETVLLRDFPLCHDFYVIALDTGMRTGEQLEMTWDRVDFTRRQVSIHRSKTGKGRSIPLTTRALAAFQRLYDRPLRGEHCFLSLNGARAQSVKHWFNEAVKTAGVREFTPYSLRHTFGARLATADVSMLKLSKLMGNSAAICERYYAHLAPSSLQEAVSRLDPPQSTKKSTTEAVGKVAVQ